ncbi:MAG: type II toxin-antitoxin system VapC family toxin [Spirochaetales bacterium]|nr:type II toxin-antitoxin system VapC family toxin [Spirochaetales bacterium]
MTVVIDASAAVEIALNLGMKTAFLRTLEATDLVLAPDTYPSEITNAFWKYAAFSGLDEASCQDGIEGCLALVDDFISTKELCKEVFAEAAKRRHPAYDLFYLIAARRHGASVVSRDKAMLALAKDLGLSAAT